MTQKPKSFLKNLKNHLSYLDLNSITISILLYVNRYGLQRFITYLTDFSAYNPSQFKIMIIDNTASTLPKM